MDLTPLILDPQKDVAGFVQEFIDRLSQDISNRLKRVG
jgi:hypothetical protein